MSGEGRVGLVVRGVDPSRSVPAFWDDGPLPGITPGQWAAVCKRRGLVAFVAEEAGGLLAGFAFAESTPRWVHVLALEGEAEARRLLLERLLKAAGEREVLAFAGRQEDGVRGPSSYLVRRARH